MKSIGPSTAMNSKNISGTSIMRAGSINQPRHQSMAVTNQKLLELNKKGVLDPLDDLDVVPCFGFEDQVIEAPSPIPPTNLNRR